MSLYEEDIPALLMSTTSYNAFKLKFFDLILKNTRRLTDSTGSTLDVLRSDEGFNIALFLNNPAQVMERYDLCIQQMNKIISEIDREYN
jgi:hypothetical protein